MKKTFKSLKVRETTSLHLEKSYKKAAKFS